MARVVLAMSGGVDSSASALLLRQQGYEVVGLFMRSGAAEEVCSTNLGGNLPIVAPRSHKQGCCSAADAADARRVADRLDIPFHALDFQNEFNRIQDYFADEYLAGRTPNPCVMCNIWLKFGRLWEFARQIGAEYIATGHYARIASADEGSIAAAGSGAPPAAEVGRTEGRREGRAERAPGEGDSVGLSPSVPPSPPPSFSPPSPLCVPPSLFRGRDRTKDQSYVLFGIDRRLLSRILFPVGDKSKAEIRELARQAGLSTADKPDSQEICFIPDHDYARFVERHRGRVETAGELVDTSGRVVGRHEGYERFTIGQRRGLGVTFGEPRFVVRIEPDTRRVVIGTREELGRTSLEADRLNWLMDPPSGPLRCTAQIRYQHTAAPCTATITGPDRLRVEFEAPQYGVAPGQAVVLYYGERVLGGGWIR